MFTELQLFSLYNNLCLAAVVFISVLVSRRNPSAFFGWWLRAYGLIVCISLSELVASFHGRSLPLDLLEFGLASGAAWYLCRAGLSLVAPARPVRGFGLGLAFMTGGAAGARLAGLPYEVACLPPVLAYLLAYVFLGTVLIRLRTGEQAATTRFVGWPMLGFALSVLVYPALEGTRWFWLGFIASGVLQLMIGAGMVVFVLEETSRRLALQNARLMELDRFKDQLLNTVSHELRTPITAVKTATYMLTANAKDPLSPGQRELMGMVAGGIDHLARLVSDILDFSKMEAGIQHYERFETDLGRIVREAEQALRPKFEAAGVALDVDVPAGGVPAEVDRARIVQVVHNLLENALKFTPRGGRVRVRVSRDAPAAAIAVEDTGIGIPPEHQARIFERFYQVDGSTARRADGMGLGLAIARAIVEEGHHGTLTVASTPGQGSTFTVTLPLAEAEDPAPTLLAGDGAQA